MVTKNGTKLLAVHVGIMASQSSRRQMADILSRVTRILTVQAVMMSG